MHSLILIVLQDSVQKNMEPDEENVLSGVDVFSPFIKVVHLFVRIFIAETDLV